MDRLWAPWRMTYIEGSKGPDADRGCVFCRARASAEPAAEQLLMSDEAAFVMLNRFPYTNGHLLVLPARHAGTLLELEAREATRLHELLRASMATLQQTFGCDGMNVGLNMGKVAGAGILDHVHWHVVPRWSGDNNFMPVIGEVRMINQHLEATWDRLREPFSRLRWNGETYALD